MSESDEGSLTVPAVWVGADELPVQFLNQFLGIVAPNEIFLTLGTIVPPAIMGETMAERGEYAQRITYVPVKPIVRLGMTPQRLEEFIRVLQDTLKNHNTMMEQRSRQ